MINMITLPDLFIFSISFICGIVPCLLWGKIGGDEDIIGEHPEWTGTIKFIHHWWIGIIIIFLGLLIPYPFNTIVFGFGFGTSVDDLFFHSFESYFNKKN